MIFITAARYSVCQKVLSKPKVCGNTERIKKKAGDRQLAQYVALLDKKRVFGHKATFHHGLERVLKRQFTQHMVNN